MRHTDIKGFVVYDIWDATVFQRGHVLKLDRESLKFCLQEYGINYVIGLARKPDPNMMNLWMDGNIQYRYYPIPDGELSKEQIEVLHNIAFDASLHIIDGGKVLSYCNAGRNRSGLMNALILWEQVPGWSGKSALEIVRRERPNAIANPYFEQYLLDLES